MDLYLPVAQHGPVNPGWHEHWYEHVLGFDIQLPEFRHGLLEQGFISMECIKYM